MPVIYEFKARCADCSIPEQKLLQLNPRFIGEDHQVDTYFNIKLGRLKLREGDIEHSLIYYERPDIKGPKQSDVLLYEHAPAGILKSILTKVHGIKAVVDKVRKIYFLQNVKFHFDHVKGLGSFIEVEAIDRTGDTGIEKLAEQCSYYAELFNVTPDDYISSSYCDLVLSKSAPEERIKLSGITAPV